MKNPQTFEYLTLTVSVIIIKTIIKTLKYLSCNNRIYEGFPITITVFILPFLNMEGLWMVYNP